MKKTLFIFIGLSVFTGCLGAYEITSMLNLTVPSQLETWQGEFQVIHRFYGLIDEKPILDNLFGMGYGANVGLGCRFNIGRGFETKASLIFQRREYIVGLGYSLPIRGIPLQSNIHGYYFTFKSSSISDDRDNGIFIQADLQTEPLLKRFTPVLNLGYDSHDESMGVGFGLNVKTFKKMSVNIEFYPSNDSDNGMTKNSFAFGLKLLTYGHHFMFLVGNNTEIGPRRLMKGAGSKDLHFGFNIYRLLEF